MKFWRIHYPDYESDYKHSYINGELSHPFGLPGVKCDVCGQTWGGSRTLPYECPLNYQKHKNIKDAWPISREAHASLQKALMKEMGMHGEPFVDLSPGDSFQPCYLNVPSRPRADFLWSCLGTLVVSERIKNLLSDMVSDDISICPVNLRKIGKREANLPPPMPSTGEPEDIIKEVPILRNKSDVGPYFEVIILNESSYPPGGTPTDICSGCKRPSVNNETRKLQMTDQMLKGNSIFFLATTLYIIVTDELRKAIEKLHPTNVIFKAI
jgi:hypothetical protein